MTRKEISEHAALVVMAVFRDLDQPGVAILAEATDLLTNFRRATLQEAARAVCRRCSSDVPIFDREINWYYHGDGIGCDASRIYDLIAELDKEADRE